MTSMMFCRCRQRRCEVSAKEFLSPMVFLAMLLFSFGTAVVLAGNGPFDGDTAKEQLKIKGIPSNLAGAAANTATWMQTYGGEGNDLFDEIIPTQDQGFAAVGGSPSGDDWHFWVVKLDAFGQVEWEYTLGVDTVFRAQIIPVLDQVGTQIGYIAAGSTFGELKGIFAIRLDLEGNVVWDARWDTERTDILYDLEPITDTFGFQIGFAMVGTASNPPASTQKAAIYQGQILFVDLDGNLYRERHVDLNGLDEQFHAAVQAHTGGIVTVGWRKSEPGGHQQGLALKLDQYGAMVWQNAFHGAFERELTAIKKTTGGYLVTGYYDDQNYGSGSVWVCKIKDEDGSIEWEYSLGHDTHYIYGVDLVESAEPGKCTVIAADSYGGVLVFKFDPINGTLDWEHRIDIPGYDTPNSIAKATGGGYIIGGETNIANTPAQREAWALKITEDGQVPDCTDISPANLTVGIPGSQTIATNLTFTDNLALPGNLGAVRTPHVSITPLSCQGSNFDFYIASMEPIQTVEGASLVKDKPTAVKVVVGKSGNVAVSGLEVVLSQGLNVSGQFYIMEPANQDPTTYQLMNPSQTLDFAEAETTKTLYFFADWLAPEANTNAYTARVELDPNNQFPQESDKSNNSKESEPKEVVTTGVGGGNRIFKTSFIKVDWQFSDPLIFDQYVADVGAFMTAAFPIAPDRMYLYTWPDAPLTTEFFRDPETGKMNEGQFYTWLAYITSVAKMTDPNADRYIVVVPPGWFEETFDWEYIRGGRQFVNPLVITEARLGMLRPNAGGTSTALHEMGHSFFLNNLCEDYSACNPDPIYDSIGSLADPGLWVEERIPMHQDLYRRIYSLMGRSGPPYQYWVELEDYQHLLWWFKQGSTDKAQAATGENGVIIAGTVEANGQIRLDPWYALPEVEYDEPSTLPFSEYTLLSFDKKGQVLNHQFLLLPDAVYSIPAENMPFSQSIAFTEGTSSIQIRKNDIVMATKQVSTHAPWVQLLSPIGGKSFNGNLTISWRAGDADGPTPLTFAVLYSSNLGQTWQTLDAGLKETSYTWVIDSLPAGDNYLVKVIASDGFNTGEALLDQPIKLIVAGLKLDTSDRCPAIEVIYPEADFGRDPHWNEVAVYDAVTKQPIGYLDAFHEEIPNCQTYHSDRGENQSVYRFHGTGLAFRQRGLPRFIQVRFEGGFAGAYSGKSKVLDLGSLPSPVFEVSPWDGCNSLIARFPQFNMGEDPHWGQVIAYDGERGTRLGAMSQYHRAVPSCPTYHTGTFAHPFSSYYYHGTPEQMRQRGLPRYVRIRFEAPDGIYSEFSSVLDLDAIINYKGSPGTKSEQQEQQPGSGMTWEE